MEKQKGHNEIQTSQDHYHDYKIYIHVYVYIYIYIHIQNEYCPSGTVIGL